MHHMDRQSNGWIARELISHSNIQTTSLFADKSNVNIEGDHQKWFYIILYTIAK